MWGREGDMRVRFSATDAVHRALERIGRTEDLHFAPGGRRFAIAGFHSNRILVIDVAPGPEPRLTDCLELESPALAEPHGLFWLDGRKLAVANRGGEVVVIAVPEAPPDRRITLEPECRLALAELLASPGSLSMLPLGLDLVELVVCNNLVHHVTRHLLDRRDGYRAVANAILRDAGLEVPDGVAHSPSGRWLAVSNHERGSVCLYRNGPAIEPDRPPAGILRDIAYPHGVRFSADERTILVADAGAPLVHLFRSERGDWAGNHAPAAKIRVLGDEAFARGHHNPREGGPKGIDLMPGTGLLAATCTEQPLAIFDLDALLDPAEPARRPGPDAELENMRATLLAHLQAARRGAEEIAETSRRAAAWETEGILRSRSWRYTAPLRWAMQGLRRLGGGSRPTR